MSSLSFADRAARSVWRLVPTRALSDAIGWGARRPIPPSLRVPVLSRFARHYGIDVSEAEKPIGEYREIDEFFTRRLRPGLRPVDGAADAVVSPADGTVVDAGVATEGVLLRAKGRAFGLAELLADDAAASRLVGGAYLITYLSPRDYHRVHSPAAGAVVGWVHVPGTLFSVNDRSVSREPGLFARNERFVTLIEGEAGFCAVVMVAAVGVGHVTAAYDAAIATHGPAFLDGLPTRARYEPGKPIARGGELGTFHLGSTTIVVFQPGRVSLDPVPPGAATRMGLRIGRIVAPGGGSA